MSQTSARRRSPVRRACAEPHACPAPVRLRALAHVPVLADLTPGELVAVDRTMTSLAWSAGEPLYRAGDPARHLYVVVSGRVRLTEPTPDGAETVTDLLVPGDLVGALDAIGTPTYPGSATALTTTCALRIDVDDFRALLAAHPSVALRVLDDVAGALARTRADVSRRSTTTVAQRVATVLLRLADRLGQERLEDGGTLLQVPLSRVDLAGMTGSTPESVSRVMTRLRRDGIVDSGRRWTAVLDRGRLADVAEGSGSEA